MFNVTIYEGVLDQVLESQTGTRLNVQGFTAYNNFLIKHILFVKNAYYYNSLIKKLTLDH